MILGMCPEIGNIPVIHISGCVVWIKVKDLLSYDLYNELKAKFNPNVIEI